MISEALFTLCSADQSRSRIPAYRTEIHTLAIVSESYAILPLLLPLPRLHSFSRFLDWLRCCYATIVATVSAIIP